MRHAKRAITDQNEIMAIFRDSKVMRLAMSREGLPYCVPVCFGYDGTSIFFHTGLTGLKIDYLMHNPSVCFELERLVRPLPHPDEGCKWSMCYESIIGFGTVQELIAPEERLRALGIIMRQYSDRKEWNFDTTGFGLCRVWQIHIESLTGRRSKHGWNENDL